MIEYINAHDLLALLGIISLGYLLGKINFRGFSLDSSGILFTALLAGHLGITVAPLFKTLGLAFFIYAIGLQAGPKFFHFLKREGLTLNLLAVAAVSLGALVTAFSILLLGIDTSLAIGIFAGALTSTPGLAAAQEAASADMTSVGYGLAYPVGVILVIVYIKLLPGIIGADPHKEARAERTSRQADPVSNRFITVKNPSVFGKTLAEINLHTVTGAVVSRLFRHELLTIPNKETVLKKDDIVRLVGTDTSLHTAEMMLGKKTEIEIPRSTIQVGQFIVTNKEMVGKTISELNVTARYNANITRIRRSGIDLPATAEQQLEWGDRVLVVGETDAMPMMKEIFGNDTRRAYAGNIYSILLGITFGVLLGLIPVSIGGVIRLKLGLTGGVLIAGLLLSSRPKLGLTIWRAPTTIINFLREMGLALFLTAVGTSSGGILWEVIKTQGLPLILISVCTALVPMIAVSWLALKKLKIRLLPLTGILTGGMTSTPGLAAASALSESHSPMLMYASVYPIAMVGMIIWVKLLALL